MRDKIHGIIKEVLENEGWSTRKDPYELQLENTRIKIDLESAKLIEVIKEECSILVEIKSFPDKSVVYDFYKAYGQYDFYRFWIDRKLLNKEIYLAVSLSPYNRIQAVGAIRDFIEAKKIWALNDFIWSSIFRKISPTIKFRLFSFRRTSSPSKRIKVLKGEAAKFAASPFKKP
ncbi:MAG: element excision factor XisH family protein [Bacteroidota bacterium]